MQESESSCTFCLFFGGNFDLHEFIAIVRLSREFPYWKSTIQFDFRWSVINWNKKPNFVPRACNLTDVSTIDVNSRITGYNFLMIYWLCAVLVSAQRCSSQLAHVAKSIECAHASRFCIVLHDLHHITCKDNHIKHEMNVIHFHSFICTATLQL